MNKHGVEFVFSFDRESIFRIFVVMGVSQFGITHPTSMEFGITQLGFTQVSSEFLHNCETVSGGNDTQGTGSCCRVTTDEFVALGTTFHMPAVRRSVTEVIAIQIADDQIAVIRTEHKQLAIEVACLENLP